MDSFYDMPRCAPAPMRIERMNIRPSVPEVSLICQPTANSNSFSNVLRQRIHQKQNAIEKNPLTEFHQSSASRYHNSTNSPQFGRKQVRFESPVLQQRPSLTYEPFIPKKIDNPKPPDAALASGRTDNKSKEQQKFDSLPKTSFEEIYMANIPNRHLDLSIVDLPKINSRELVKSTEEIDKDMNKENKLPKTYKEFLATQEKISEAQKEEIITDILNYKRNNVHNSLQAQNLFINSNKSSNDSAQIKSDEFKFQNLFHNKEVSNDQINSDELQVQHSISNNQQSYPQIKGGEFNFSYNPTSYQNPNGDFINHDLPISKGYNPPYTRTVDRYYDCKFAHEDCLKETHCQNQNACQKVNHLKDFTPSNEMITTATKPQEKQELDHYEPSNRDLLKIIAQQNEQLLILQKQVAMLLNKEHVSQNKPIEAPPGPSDYKDNQKQSRDDDCRFLSQVNMTPRKHGLSKFSLDVMTSFEVAIRPQHNRQGALNYNSSKIQEITEEESAVSSTTDANRKNVDQSLHLQEPLKVIETCPSPEPSININMNDYDSSDDEAAASEIGATFYHNLMGQVNNILKQAQIQTKEELYSRGIGVRQKKSHSITNRTMQRVREATIEHLRNIGVTIGPSLTEDESSKSESSEEDAREYSPTEISYGVKQLLMKYLPSEHLSKVPQKQKYLDDRQTGERQVAAAQEFSVASLQYMKKYNLLPSSGKQNMYKKNQSCPRENTDDKNCKILDLTSLKMQPKLL